MTQMVDLAEDKGQLDSLDSMMYQNLGIVFNEAMAYERQLIISQNLLKMTLKTRTPIFIVLKLTLRQDISNSLLKILSCLIMAKA